MHRLLHVMLFVAALGECRGQAMEPAEPRLFVGFGGGIDQGGAGARLDARFTPHVGLFLGLGATFAGPGVNAGVHGRILPARTWCPYVTAMYGYNADAGGHEESRLYYGPSFGGGVEWRKGTKHNFFRAGVLFPVRSEEAQEVSDNAAFPFWPLLPTFAWHFSIRKK